MDKSYQLTAKVIRVIESCTKFEHMGMAYDYWYLAHQKLKGHHFYNTALYGEKAIRNSYDNKYKELKPKEEENDNNN